MSNGPELLAGAEISLSPIDTEADAPFVANWNVSDNEPWLPLDERLSPADVAAVLRVQQEMLQGVIDDADVVAWVVRHRKEPVGVVRVDMRGSEYVQAPVLSNEFNKHRVFRTPVARLAITAAAGYLADRDHAVVRSYYRVGDVAEARLLRGAGFRRDGGRYRDEGWALWQNVAWNLA